MSTIPVQVLSRRLTLQTGRRGLNGLLSVLVLPARDLHEVKNARLLGLYRKDNRLCQVKMYSQSSMRNFAGKGQDYIFRQVGLCLQV